LSKGSFFVVPVEGVRVFVVRGRDRSALADGAGAALGSALGIALSMAGTTFGADEKEGETIALPSATAMPERSRKKPAINPMPRIPTTAGTTSGCVLGMVCVACSVTLLVPTIPSVRSAAGRESVPGEDCESGFGVHVCGGAGAGAGADAGADVDADADADAGAGV
jgi:hypothetical protein